MPLCAAGSERKPDAPAYLILDASYAAQILPPPVQWLIPYVPFLQPISLSLDTFCSIDPSEVEIPTAVELVALVTRSPYAVAFAAGVKVASILHYFAWYTFCRCSDDEPLPAPDYPSAPADLPIVNPPQFSPPGGYACRTDVISVSCTGSDDFDGDYVAWPLGATSFRMTFQKNNPAYPLIMGIHPFDSEADGSINSLSHRVACDPFNGPITVWGAATSHGDNWGIWDIPIGAGYRAVFRINGPLGSYDDVTSSGVISIEWFCGNDPTTPPTSFNPCVSCPPDPYLQGAIAQILGELSILKLQVDLIQRQAVPFATVDGDLHDGLTGNGEISVQGLVGVRVAIVDSIEGTVSVTDGHPETLHGTGWIRWGDDVGWRERVFLSNEVTLSTPYVASAMTKIGYSLPPGMEIDIVTLEREP
jgi:hypothetical protein